MFQKILVIVCLIATTQIALAAFPTNPNNNDAFVQDGVRYKYKSATGVWEKQVHPYVVNPLEYGSALTDATIQLALTAIGATNAELVIDASYVISNNVTIPDNVKLKIIRGGSISIDNTKTLTINGEIEAPDATIFSGAGSVVFGRNEYLYKNIWLSSTLRGQVFTTTLNAATGDQSALKLSYTTNKLTSGNDTALEIVQTDTASPGRSYLINTKVGTDSKFNVQNNAHISTQHTSPIIVSSCGTNPSIVSFSNDVAGAVLVGTVATGCTLTFASQYTNAPSCVLSSDNTAEHFTYVVTNVAITITEVEDISENTIYYNCIGLGE